MASALKAPAGSAGAFQHHRGIFVGERRMHEADVGQQSADTIKLTFKESEASELVQFALNNELLPK